MISSTKEQYAIELPPRPPVGAPLWYLLGVFATIVQVQVTAQFRPSCRPSFSNSEERDLLAHSEISYSKIIDISRVRTFSFLVHNNGPDPVIAQPELSPDQVIWGSHGELPYTIPPGENQLFVLQFFLRYARLKFRTKRPGEQAKITVWFQGQG